MSDITFTTTPNEDGKTVTAIYVYNGVTHERSVNAVLDEDGNIDAEATEVRCEEIARGVKNKIDIGAISPPAADPEPADPEQPA
jgi:hypothetical protein